MERLEKGVAAVVKPVVQSLTGNYGKPLEQSEQTRQIEQNEAKRLQEARTRLAQINKEIIEARKKREQKQQGEKQEEKKPPSLKLRKAKEKESVLAKMIKSRQGSKEAMQRASG